MTFGQRPCMARVLPADVETCSPWMLTKLVRRLASSCRVFTASPAAAGETVRAGFWCSESRRRVRVLPRYYRCRHCDSARSVDCALFPICFILHMCIYIYVYVIYKSSTLRYCVCSFWCLSVCICSASPVSLSSPF